MTTDTPKKGIVSTVLVLGPFVFAFAFALDMYIPAVPQIRAYFQTSQDLVQLTLSLFLFCLAVGQLYFGPLSDQFGRKRVAIFSALLFTIGCLLTIFVDSIYTLIITRVIQATGGCGMVVCAYAIVRDNYSGNTAAKVFSYLNSMISISPLFAPILGGYLVVVKNWRWCFGFLTLLGIAATILMLVGIKETHPQHLRVRFDRHILKRYREILSSRQFLVFAFCAGSGSAAFFTFFSSSPYVLINLLHIPTEYFGYYFGVLGIVYLFGSLLVGRLVTKLGIVRIVITGSLLLLLSGVIMLLWYFASGLTALNFIIPIAITSLGGAFLMSASAAGALEPFGHISGTASAMIGCLQFGYSSIIGTVLMHWPIKSTMPLASCFIFLGFSVFVVLHYNKNHLHIST